MEGAASNTRAMGWIEKRSEVCLVRYFPKNNRAQNSSFEDQLFKMKEEHNEVWSACIEDECDERIAEEIFDLIHVCEGLLDKLNINREAIRRAVIAKNKARGDYDKS